MGAGGESKGGLELGVDGHVGRKSLDEQELAEVIGTNSGNKDLSLR